MNRYLLFLSCILVTLSMGAQDKSKYLAGAVPEVNGKVVFSKTISVNTPISENDLFNAMDKWAQDNYKETEGNNESRVLLSSLEDKDIACMGEKELVFKKSLLVLDRAQMQYQLILNIEPNKCIVTIRNIRYEYPDYKTPVSAEDLISDEIALNKKKEKMNRYYDKFRMHTVDSINGIFNSIDTYLNGKVTTIAPQYTSEQKKTENTIPATSGTTREPMTASLVGYKKVSADKIPANMLNKQALIVTGTTKQPVVITGEWAGTTSLLDKLMGLSTITQSSQGVGKDQTYTISFYTEIYSDAVKEFESAEGNVKDRIEKAGFTLIATPSGAPVFSEAWMIIECKKAGEMPSTGTNKTDIGEILNVWIK